jgi:hypothetical protein
MSKRNDLVRELERRTVALERAHVALGETYDRMRTSDERPTIWHAHRVATNARALARIAQYLEELVRAPSAARGTGE